jgi:hypothetical protein
MSNFTIEAPQPVNVPLGGAITPAIRHSVEGNVQQNQSSQDDMAVSSLPCSPPLSIARAVDKTLCESMENDDSKTAKPRPAIAAHDMLSADHATVLAIPETTPEPDTTIESDDPPTTLNIPAEEPIPRSLSLISNEHNYEKSFSPDLASFEKPVVYHSKEARMPSHEMLSPIKETETVGSLKRKQAGDFEPEGVKVSNEATF